MKKKISDLCCWIIMLYWYAVFFLFNIYIILFCIFGGEFSIHINWNSWSQLVEALNRM